MNSSFLPRLFEELTYLNKVPKFQLERAISPLLGIFIIEIINKHLNADTTISLPEFPLKKSGNYQSTNIDWLLVDVTNKTLYCIELKTDFTSFRIKQSDIYKAIKDLVEKDGAAELFSQVNIIRSKSRRKDKYAALQKRIPIELDFTAFKRFKIVYLVPYKPPKLNADEYDEIILFSDLSENINTPFPEEWTMLREFLIDLKKNIKIPQHQQEGNIAVFKDLGIYSDNPEEDEIINQDLIKFLDSQGYKRPEPIQKSDDN